MIYAIKNEDQIQDREELDDLQSKVKQVGLVEKLGKQGYHYDMKELFEPITKTLTDTHQKIIEEPHPTQKQLRIWMNQINTLKL